MSNAPNTVRLHRILRASPERVYRAFLDPDAIWWRRRFRTARSRTLLGARER